MGLRGGMVRSLGATAATTAERGRKATGASARSGAGTGARMSERTAAAVADTRARLIRPTTSEDVLWVTISDGLIALNANRHHYT